MPITPYLANVLAAMDPAQSAAMQVPVQDPAQLQDLAAAFNATDAAHAPPPPAPHETPVIGAPPVGGADSFHQLAAVDFKQLQDDNARKAAEAAGPAHIPPPLPPAAPPPAPNVGAQAPIGPPPPPAPGLDAHAFDLAPTQAGGAPAHEVEMRGPSLLNAQGHRNESVASAYDTVAARNQEAVNNEFQVAVSQERLARVRESAYQQSLAEQEDDLATRQADFDTTAKQISKLGQLNPDRLWASKTTAQKIAGGIEIMLAGFRGAPSMVMKKIDEDIRAQEFAYGAARDAANAKQTAFSAAMAKYQNLGAARAMAKAASIDVLQAQLAQVAAKNKGTETGNRAILAMADLDNEKMLQIQNGIRYLPAQAGGRYYVNPKTGLVYNEKEAHEYYAKQQEYSQQERLEGGKVGGQILVEGMKANAQKANAPDTRVQLPNGDIVTAPSPPEAEKIRTLAVSVANANQLVDQAKAIRSQTGWWASPEKMKDLNRIQAELTLAFKDRGGLGALSGPDMELALKGTSDITSIGPGVDHALDGFQSTTSKALQNRVRTIPGAPSSAGGQLSEEAKSSLGGYSKQ